MRKGCVAFLLLFPVLVIASGGLEIPLKKAHVNLRDNASLQRGAKWFMNYCSGCHALSYARFNLLAKGIGIVDKHGNPDKKLLDNLIFTGVNMGDTAHNAIPIEQAQSWFGIPPPDLTLVARVRGSDWLFTYLTSFYKDDNQQWGSNNLVFPGVAMPNVLEPLQGTVLAMHSETATIHNGATQKSHPIEYLEWVGNGKMDHLEFEAMARDLVNFLTYIAEPAKLKRQQMGIWVLLFLLVLGVFAYLLKKEYWRDVK